MMDPYIDRRVKELISLSLDGPDFRVSLVVTLLKDALFEDALEQSLPLIGTRYTSWFLYVEAWSQLAKGKVKDAFRLLTEAYRGLDQEFHCWEPKGFAFTEYGKPKVALPFNAPLTYNTPGGPSENENPCQLNYTTALFDADWLTLYQDIGCNIREYKYIFELLARSVERIVHHEIETVAAAVAAMEFEDDGGPKSNPFLLLSLMSEEHLKIVSDTLWRVCVDWNYPLMLCEVTSYFMYLLEENEVAVELANIGLASDPTSLVCGNVRALVLNRIGCIYHADDQWRETLKLSPGRSVTYLVLGHQALCAGGLDAALRYFVEAVNLGDNRMEAERFLNAALECSDE